MSLDLDVFSSRLVRGHLGVSMVLLGGLIGRKSFRSSFFDFFRGIVDWLVNNLELGDLICDLNDLLRCGCVGFFRSDNLIRLGLAGDDCI